MITPHGIERLVDDIRTEATERAETAIEALRGVPLEQPEHPSPADFGPQMITEMVLEHPSSPNVENPYAAILGHVSEAERLYIAAHELEHVSRGRASTADRIALNIEGNHHLDREFHELKHELREDAHRAIKARLEVHDNHGDQLVKDPATGWRKRISVNHLGSASERHHRQQAHLERAPRDALEAIVNEVSKHRPAP